MSKKRCFLISEIGAPGSPVRNRVDQWKEVIYKSALDTDYELICADEIAAPGHITIQILDHIVNDDLAIIDLTGLNPNVMYETAIRHLTKKPFIQIAPLKCEYPFDIKDLRSITYDPSDLKYPEKLIQDLKAAEKEISSPEYKAPEIVKKSFDLEQISKDPEALGEYILKKLGIGNQSTAKKIVKVDDWSSLSYGDKVTCPNCGIIWHIDDWDMSNTENQYRCENCGTEFTNKRKKENFGIYKPYNGTTDYPSSSW